MDRAYIGVDLGQAHDFTAIAVVERCEWRGAWDAVAYAHRKEAGLRLRYLERVALGTPYPEVVERVKEVAQASALAGRCELVVDATGVGRPVVDLLRRARPGCGITPVVVTSGDRATWGAGSARVPKRELMTGLQVLLQNGELRIARGVAWGSELLGEMNAMRVKVGPSGREQFGAWREGTHDDLVFAVALASWKAKRQYPQRTGEVWGWNRESDLGKRLLGM